MTNVIAFFTSHILISHYFPFGKPLANQSINFLNGELWIGDKGEVELLPHKPESRLIYCLPFEYDPEAKADKYENALLGIFSETI